MNEQKKFDWSKKILSSIFEKLEFQAQITVKEIFYFLRKICATQASGKHRIDLIGAFDIRNI